MIDNFDYGFSKLNKENDVKSSKMYAIFPFPIYSIEFNPEDFLEEEKFIKNIFFKNCKESNDFRDSLRSLDFGEYSISILNAPEIVKLKTVILKYSIIFMSNVMGYEEGALITTSWVNLYRKGNKLSPHTHPNSIINGVYYLDVNDKATITFHKKIHYFSPYYEIEPQKINPVPDNIFTKELIKLPVKKGTLLLFPANLPHSVSETTSDDLRWSLAFNVIPKFKFIYGHAKDVDF